MISAEKSRSGATGPRATQPRRVWPGLGAAVPALLPGSAQAAGGLNLIPDVEPLVVLIVGFVLLIYPLNQLLFKPLFGVLDERESQILGARRRGEKLLKDAEEVLGRYREAIRQAREDAEAERRAQLETTRSEQTSLTLEARQEAERELEQARGSLERSLDEIRGGLRTEAETLAREVASRVLGRSLS